MRYIIKLSYDGSGFCGWQVQKNAVTVQGELSKALSMLTGSDTEITGAGRTDTSVNAINYIAHFDVANDPIPDTARLTYKLNAILPKSIVIHDIFPTSEDFHARFSAVSREYRYFIHRQKDPFIARHSWLCRYPIDVDKMNRAASFLLGTHDFRCFEKTGGNNVTSICTIYEAAWEFYVPQHFSFTAQPQTEIISPNGTPQTGNIPMLSTRQTHDGNYLIFRIRADRFLRNMVRAIVGTLVDIGRGKRDPQWIETLINGGSRCDAGESVPGNALFLCEVKYPDQYGL